MTAQTKITKPCRITVKAARHTPPDAVFVGPGSEWSNPYQGTGSLGTHAYVANLFRQHIWRPNKFKKRVEIRAELSARNLACTCPQGQPCHADILLEIANGTE